MILTEIQRKMRILIQLMILTLVLLIIIAAKELEIKESERN
jgi:hypothetical protein